MNTLWQDLRYGARVLLRTPGFTLIAVLTLALGIGANTAIFSIVNGVLLKPLPFKESERLVIAWNRMAAAAGGERTPLAVSDLLDWRAQNRSFESVGGYPNLVLNFIGREVAQRGRRLGVAANLFS